MRYKTTILIVIPFILSQSASAGVWNDTKTYVEKIHIWESTSQPSLSFHEIFPKPIYKKSYFGFVITGVIIVSAGAISFFTAGAGAPIAAMGVGPAATWVGGGGGGSYMAGLSTIGGWFGGNATLGAAILNGISMGVVGGGPSAFAALPVIGKVAVLTSVTASALDGVALFEKPETKSLTYRVRLLLPRGVGSKNVQDLAKKFQELEEDLQEADSNSDKTSYELLVKKKMELVTIGHKWAKDALLLNSTSNEDLLVLGVFSKNVGDFDLFEKLISKVRTDKIADTGYADYLSAIVSIEKGGIKDAQMLLSKSFRLNPYAIEAPLLLVNILGKDFKAKEKEILAIVEKAKNDFDADKYETGYSLVSMYYRVGTFYLVNKKFDEAKHYYESALDEMPIFQKYLGNKQMVSMIKMGIANSLYGQNKKKEADQMYIQIITDSKDSVLVDFFRNQYAGALDQAAHS